jgi:SAM-dependent methyltransferase
MFKWLTGNSRQLAELQAQRDALLRERDELQQRVQALTLCGAPTELDRTLYSIQPPLPFDPWEWLAGFANTPASTILEIGAREVVGKSAFKARLPLASYTGFDFHAGPNVDVVGDAHRLSEHFAANHFDVVYSTAVFEHLALPWIVTEEIAKLLKVGGVACISTHFSWSEHEMPWHFFQFNNTGLEAMFNQRLGFETIASGKEMPMVGRFSYDCDKDHAGKPIANLYCSSYIITRKVRDVFGGDKPQGFAWRDALDGVYGGSQYPADSSLFPAKAGS